MKLTRSQEERLIQIGLNAVLDLLNDKPTPVAQDVPVEKTNGGRGRPWSEAQKAKLRKTLAKKRKAAAKS